MTDYAKHIEGLEDIIYDSQEAEDEATPHVTAAIDLMRAAISKNATEERRHCQEMAKQCGGMLSSAVDAFEFSRAAARAEGFAAGREVGFHEGAVADAAALEHELSAAKAEITQWRSLLDSAQAEIERLRTDRDTFLAGHVSALETKLANLRAAAELHLERNPVAAGVFGFRAAIEASR